MSFEDERYGWATGEVKLPLGTADLSTFGKGIKTLGKDARNLSEKTGGIVKKREADSEREAAQQEKEAKISQAKADSEAAAKKEAEELPGHFKTLGLHPSASPRQFKDAYAAQVKRLHPKTSGLRGAAKKTAEQHLVKVDKSAAAIQRHFRKNPL